MVDQWALNRSTVLSGLRMFPVERCIPVSGLQADNVNHSATAEPVIRETECRQKTRTHTGKQGQPGEVVGMETVAEKKIKQGFYHAAPGMRVNVSTNLKWKNIKRYK